MEDGLVLLYCLDRIGLDWIGLDVGIPPMVIAINAFRD
jgi:hypothetical protein